MSDHIGKFKNNLNRVDSFLSLYQTVKDSNLSDSRKDYKYTDILRAAVVFLHSSFEDYIRNILIERLSETNNSDSLKDIAFPGQGKRSTKISLDFLLDYRDLNISQFIEESVRSTMGEVSFNNVGTIKEWLRKIDISIPSFSKEREIQDLIQRRHRIVHEADMHNSSLRQIKYEQVKKWKESVIEFVNVIDSQIDKGDFADE